MMKRRKGWHRKKRRLKHDHWAQLQRTLTNHYRRSLFAIWREGKAPLLLGMEEHEAERNAGPRPATDNEVLNV